jgi:hypothetical protein
VASNLHCVVSSTIAFTASGAPCAFIPAGQDAPTCTQINRWDPESLHCFVWLYEQQSQINLLETTRTARVCGVSAA